MTDRIATQPWLRGSVTVNALLAFGFGVCFLTAMLVFATQYPNPTSFQVRVFVTTLALSAAGVGAMLPGTLNLGNQPLFRATGALALFAAVFFFQPKIAETVVQFVAPPSSPEPIALEYLHKVDEGKIREGWDELDPAAHGVSVDTVETLQRLYQSYRKPLGVAVTRELVGTSSIQSPQGYPLGLYQVLNYRTKFSNSTNCRQEAVTLRATQDLKWRVFSHLIGPTAIECQ
ncbi:MAG: hypothetical protein QOF41_838 [Methylobacteriaceae bacterium]|nr:hypothetical protein [Methylobacteriaceae bacterium]